MSSSETESRGIVSNRGANPEMALIDRLRRTIDRTIQSLVPAGSRCALIDFPSYRNVGDSLIWLGELACLDRCRVGIAYQSDIRAFDADLLERRLPEGPILLSGGGNFGDLWPLYQEFRERIVQRFPDRLIVQLPQSIWFEENSRLEKARAILATHPQLTLLVRDHSSLTIARERLGLRAHLCPDMAFALPPLPPPRPPETDVVWLRRTDKEAIPGSTDLSTAPTGVDWVGKERDPRSRLREQLTRRIATRRRFRAVLQAALEKSYRPAARRRLRFGVRILERGRVVVSDRLHGYVLSLLLGIPHVILDNSYGKLTSFHRAWTTESESTFTAEGIDRALAIAKELANRPGSRRADLDTPDTAVSSSHR